MTNRLPQSPLLGLTIAPDSQHIEPGEQAVFLLSIENKSREAQTQSLEIAGLSQDWYRVDFDARRRVFPGEQRSATLLVSVPRSEASAIHQFTVTVRAAGAESSVAGTLEVRGAVVAPAPPPPPEQPAEAPVPPPAVSLSPQEVSWQGQGEEVLRVNVRNNGEKETSYKLSIQGLQRGWFTAPSGLSVPRGQVRTAEVRIHPSARASQRDYAFKVIVTAEEGGARSEVESRLRVGAPAESPRAAGGGMAPISVQPEPAPTPRAQAAPVLPPEVTLGPRTTFHFGTGDVAAQAIITVQNRSRLIEGYTIAIEGIAEEWYDLPMTQVRLEPGASAQVPLRLTPRAGGTAVPSGEYRFRVRVAPHSFPDSFAEVGGVISIAGVAAFDARLTPVQTAGRKEKFKLTLLNTGGVPLSLLIEGSDPEGMCTFRYPPPPNLEPGEQAVVPIWVGARRNGFAGQPKALDVQFRVAPAGSTSTAARTFNARFVHEPFLSSRMLSLSALFAVLAMVIGMIFVLGTSKVSHAFTVISCGFDDDYREFSGGPVLVREKCGGAPIPCQKGFCAAIGETVVPTTPTARPSTPSPTAVATPTTGPPACVSAPDIGLAVGRNVTLREDARIRADAGVNQQIVGRGNNRPGVVVSGPKCVDNLVWWEVDSGLRGWTAERDENGVQLILPR
ncbi:MAG TPA: hypothetical protein VNN10_01500 [Dehalococcoidia bacterium]|nr:hypothetical protein [Dehalococcoidia bacterium]